MELFKFPTGETHCKISEYGDYLFIPMNDYLDGKQNLNDYFMTVMMAADIFRRRGELFNIFLPYLPYSRQDRPTTPEEPFSLKVIGDMLNTIPYSKLFTLDVHSDVAYGCVRDLVNIGVDQIWRDLPKNKTLIIPDQGAFKKLSKIAGEFNDSVIAVKKRDMSTGRLEIVAVVGDVEFKDCIIVDDICDGGGTFIQLAEYLYGSGATSVELAVTHGIFTKGTMPLFDAGIKKIYTTDSFYKGNDSRIKVVHTCQQFMKEVFYD